MAEANSSSPPPPPPVSLAPALHKENADPTPAALQGAPRAVRQAFPLALSFGFGIIGAVAVLWFFTTLAWLLTLLYLAFVAATILESPVAFLKKRVGMGRGLATALVLIGGLGLVALLAFLMAAQVTRQFDAISAALERWPAAIQVFINRLAERFPDLAGRLPQIDWPNLAAQILPAWQSVARNALNGVALLTHGILLFFLVMYMLIEGPDQLQGLARLLPRRARQEVTEVFGEMASTHRRWFLATLANMVATATLTFIGLSTLGVPNALVLGVIAGFGELVPNIGPMGAAIPSLLVTLATRPEIFWYVVLMFLIVQTIQGYGVSPFVMRLGVKMSVLALIVSVLAMGTLLGFMGVLVAVPLMGDIIVLCRYFNRVVAQDQAARERAQPEHPAPL